MTTDPNRRDFISASAGAVLAGSVLSGQANAAGKTGNLQLATFRFDVTPPMNHSLCGGWIKPVVGVDDPLEAIGYVLLGAGRPIVVCAVDWTGILNSAPLQWANAASQSAV